MKANLIHEKKPCSHIFRNRVLVRSIHGSSWSRLKPIILKLNDNYLKSGEWSRKYETMGFGIEALRDWEFRN